MRPEKWFRMDWALRYADSIDPVAPIRKTRQSRPATDDLS